MRTDDGAMSPEIEAALAAVDGVLAGEAVAPEHAELAELALLLRSERSVADDAWVAAMDERVRGRFQHGAGAAPRSGSRPRRRWRWLYAPTATLAATAAGVAVVIALGSGGGGGSSSAASSSAVSSSAAAGTAAPAHAAPSNASASSSASAGSSAGAAGSAAGGAASTVAAPSHAAAGKRVPSLPNASVPAPAGTAPVPGPVSGGNRQIVQSAQVQLAAAPSRIDDVAQQVFETAAAQDAIVQSSNVTGGGSVNGNAQFQLSVPSGHLEAALNALSHLRGARVLSRTDSTSDITGQVGGAGRRLAEARALRTSLLKQLAAATTTEEIDSLQARIHDADASISSDLATLRRLQHTVAYSEVSVTVAGLAPPPLPVHHSGGFTIGRAAHDAGRVLVVVAGVALIALAVLVPLGLLAALGAWGAAALRRRRREQALDLI